MSIEDCRKDFPILARNFNGRPLVYLDSAATSQKPTKVIEVEADFYNRLNANVHRGVYALSEEATAAYEGARERAARFVGAKDPEEIVFVRGTTEALNLLATSLSRSLLAKGDRVVSTEMEHHSNIVPWHFLRESPGIQLDFVGINEEGELIPADLERLVTKGVKVTTFTHVSNTLGTLNPVREIADRAREAGSLSILDAAQSAPHLKLDVTKLGVDFLAFSGHKVLGPTGIGVLWGRKELLKKIAPYMGGGEMIMEVERGRVTYKDPPYKFEAGTPNIAGAVTLAAALEYLDHLGWEDITAHDRALVADAWTRLHDAFGEKVRTFGPPPERGHYGVVSFALKGVHPHDMASLLDHEGVAIRAGHHCAQLVMRRYGVPAMSRASYSVYNTKNDTARLVDALQKTEAFFRGVA
ncbi:MAG: SufS family cysteine desulfurase [Candidatus Thermoplasmatota archaeon]|jgi:cysteine desulfurase/selenocysteine lyase|nr:SufS family cysteine desulfurase [Candidatus Thermoplasmatota archaeon]